MDLEPSKLRNVRSGSYDAVKLLFQGGRGIGSESDSRNFQRSAVWQWLGMKRGKKNFKKLFVTEPSIYENTATIG